MRKLRSSGFTKQQLVCVYSIHIRSILEYGSILWAFSINKDLIERLNSIEWRVLSIVTGRYVSKNKHVNVCKDLGIETPTSRHLLLLKKFGMKLTRSDRFKRWLEPYTIIRQSNSSSRYNRNKYNFRLVACKYERYRRSTSIIIIMIIIIHSIIYNVQNERYLIHQTFNATLCKTA